MKEITRRAFVLGGVSTVVLGTTRISEIASKIELGNRHPLTVAHNATDSVGKFEKALLSDSDYVEADLTAIDGKIVVAHDLKRYQERPQEINALLNPNSLFEKVLEAGKNPMIDLKDEVIDMRELAKVIHLKDLPTSTMISSKNHALLIALRKSGFEGTILFTIDSQTPLKNFLVRNQETDFSKEEYRYGVSIRHSLLWDGSQERNIVKRLRSMGLQIAAWTPNTDGEIYAAARNSNIIISDNYKRFSRI